MTFEERYRLNSEKINTIKGLIGLYGESLIARLRQSPEERRARIEAHKHRYKESFMEVLSQAREKRWAKSMGRK